MGILSCVVSVFKGIMVIIGYLLNLQDLWEKVSGKNGKKEQRYTLILLILFFFIYIWIVYSLNIFKLKEFIVAIKPSGTNLNLFWILQLVIALVSAVILWRICNIFYFHLKRKKTGRKMGGERKFMTYSDIRAMEKRREEQ